MKKILISIITICIALLTLYYVAVYYLTFSEGYRSGELVKISNKGIVFKTWEGKLSQGISEELQFEFSIEDKEKEVIEGLKNLQGQKVKLTYIERFGTFPWLGDTKYFVTKVEKATEKNK
jgi:hypothetical protein